MNLQRKKFSHNLGGRELTIETSILAEQATSSVLAKLGDTVVLVTVVLGKEDRKIDYFPLTVDFEEKFYAAGKIIGSRFIRREGRPSEDAILSGRLIDRALRPLFDHRLRRDVQVVVTILSIDEENDPDLVALNAASIALAISPIPWNGPVAGLRIAKIGKNLISAPKNSEVKDPNLVFETFVSGPRGRISMIELSGKEASEKEIMEGFVLAEKEIEKILDFEEKIIKEIGKPKFSLELSEPNPNLVAKIKEYLSSKLERAIYVKDKTERNEGMEKLKDNLYEYLNSPAGGKLEDLELVDFIVDEEINQLLHRKVLEEESRPDGRKLDELRELYAETSLFKRTHGSALFIRGNTQSLAVVTLAPPGSEQLVETIEATTKRRFMLHYNFPQYSVGEVGTSRGPGRREIGHGALAEKALKNLIPSQEEFPYTIRVVSEILSSNGSSSMASVCAGSLSMMDAGVPLKKPAAGIAMGLIMDEKKFKVLTDIQGPEDHHGDMDLKVAGTDMGVTAMQMDVKITGLTLEILESALAQAKKARLEILSIMNKTLAKPKPELSPYAPSVFSLDINPAKIGEVIGPGGKVINQIIKDTGVISIDIEQTGKVFIAATSKEAGEKAMGVIQMITKEFRVGEIVEGVISKIMDFGAILDLGGGKDGMIHVSELSKDYVKEVTSVVRLGDRLRAKIIKLEPNGRIGLSIKALNE